MKRWFATSEAALCFCISSIVACGEATSDPPRADATSTADASLSDDAGASGDASPANDAGPLDDDSGVVADGSTTEPTAEDVRMWIDAYRAAHPGNGGKDWDINAKTPVEVAADPAAQQLLALCAPDQRPVIPLLAWEYGGGDHQWIDPAASALVYCVYTPVQPSTSNWAYDPVQDHVTADVYVRFPEENPCKDRVGAEQVSACIGDVTNFEIMVDTASYNDGVEAGLGLSQSSTELRLILIDGTKVHLVDNI